MNTINTMSIDLATKKNNLIKELNTIVEILLCKLEQFLADSKKDWFNELSLNEKDEIEVGLKQANNNETVSHEKAMKKFSKWH